MDRRTIELQERTHQFFLRVIRFCEESPNEEAVESIRPQLLDSAGSTDSNYRAACKARSRREFIAKIRVAAEEADESYGWLAALLGAGYGDRTENQALLLEADELTRILTASHKTAKTRHQAEETVKKRQRSRSHQSARQSSIGNWQ